VFVIFGDVAGRGDPVWVVLLVGIVGVVGTLAGGLLAWAGAARVARDDRREARQVAAKTFQRDTLVNLTDALLEIHVSLDALRRSVDADERLGIEARYRAADLRVRVLAARVRDDRLRVDVERLLGEFRDWKQHIVPVESVVPQGQRDSKAKAESLNRSVSERAGELIRTLDEAIEEN
jgi:hypothetical protein